MSTTRTWTREQPIISGLWKFSSDVTMEQLQELAEEWATQWQPTSGYEQLYIRGSGKHEALALGFRYRMNRICNLDNAEGVRSHKQAHAAFFHKYTDQLKKRFGNDFIGHDLSSPTWTLVMS